MNAKQIVEMKLDESANTKTYSAADDCAYAVLERVYQYLQNKRAYVVDRAMDGSSVKALLIVM